MRTTPRDKLRAVYDDDLEGLLQSLGLLSDFKGGRLHCALSDDVIDADNLYALYPHGGTVKVACSKVDCIAKLLMLQEAQQE